METIKERVVLIPVDDSAASETAVTWAIENLLRKDSALPK
jgi:hypothetical protein